MRRACATAVPASDALRDHARAVARAATSLVAIASAAAAAAAAAAAEPAAAAAAAAATELAAAEPAASEPAAAGALTFHAMEEFHISLSKTFPLRVHEIAPFAHRLRDGLVSDCSVRRVGFPRLRTPVLSYQGHA